MFYFVLYTRQSRSTVSCNNVFTDSRVGFYTPYHCEDYSILAPGLFFRWPKYIIISHEQVKKVSMVAARTGNNEIFCTVSSNWKLFPFVLQEAHKIDFHIPKIPSDQNQSQSKRDNNHHDFIFKKTFHCDRNHFLVFGFCFCSPEDSCPSR